MTNEIAKQSDNFNPFISYGEQVSQRTIVGKLLKFSKGHYYAGEESEEIIMGSRFVANFDNFLVGWIKWQDNKPVEQIMGKLADAYQPPKRQELGDNDPDEWEVDEITGKPRDPWQYSNYLLLQFEDAGEDPDGLYTFTASSKGGINAVGKLSIAYGRAMRQHANEWPVIELGTASYKHSNRAYGMIAYPVLTIVGWSPKSAFPSLEGETAADNLSEDEDIATSHEAAAAIAPPAPATRAAAKAAMKEKAAAANLPNASVPPTKNGRRI